MENPVGRFNSGFDTAKGSVYKLVRERLFRGAQGMKDKQHEGRRRREVLGSLRRTGVSLEAEQQRERP